MTSESLIEAIEALKITPSVNESDGATSYAATRNSVLNEAIAVARQDRFNPEMQLQQREISDTTYIELERAIRKRFKGFKTDTFKLSESQAGMYSQTAMEIVSPYLAPPEPVSIEAFGKKLVSWAWMECQPTGDGFGFIDDNTVAITKTILDAAGVKYVD